jgi:hypothetical protein
MSELIYLNKPQQISVMLAPKNKVDIWGRGTGKSFEVGWDVNHVNRTMPRAVTSVTGQTYGQLLTRTLPSTFKFLEKLGYKKDEGKENPGNYVIGRRPPSHFIEPMEKLMKWDTIISFSTGNALLLLSQDRSGSSRGPNVDYEIIDEAITISKQRYDEETSPTNRGNEEIWGLKSPKPIPWHHGFHYVSSMPYTAEQKWLLDFGKYYEIEAGIRIFDIWNRIVKLQLQIIEAAKSNDTKEFKQIWNEAIRLKRQIAPFVSKDGLLFTLSNAFDNIENVGFSYIIREYEKQTLLTFLIEIMNMIMDKVEDCYYHIEDQKHVYYNATNDNYIKDLAENTNYDFNKLSTPDSRFDLDCDAQSPLEISFDWGVQISLMLVGQEKGWDYISKERTKTDNFINEFYVKPDTAKKIMIYELIDQFCNYYKYHINKRVLFHHDRYGDNKLPNNSKSFNDQAIDRFNKHGWIVVHKYHKGMEPPHHDKYLLWGNVLKEADSRFPKIRFNGNKCKYLLISMNNTQVIESHGKFEKNKKSEHRDSGTLPEEATHFGDAADKRIWTKYGNKLIISGTFIPIRMK